MIDKFKQQSSLTLASIILFALGLFFIFAPSGMIQSMIFGIIGITLMVSGIVKLISLNAIGSNKNELVFPILTIVIGALVLFNVTILLVICAIILLVEPIKKLITTKDLKQQFMLELPRLILPIILILLCFNSTYTILFITLGILLLICSGFVVYTILTNKPLVFIVSNRMTNKDVNRSDKRNNDDIIDVEEE